MAIPANPALEEAKRLGLIGDQAYGVFNNMVRDVCNDIDAARKIIHEQEGVIIHAGVVQARVTEYCRALIRQETRDASDRLKSVGLEPTVENINFVLLTGKLPETPKKKKAPRKRKKSTPEASTDPAQED